LQKDEEHIGVGGRSQRGVQRRRNDALHINEGHEYGWRSPMARGSYFHMDTIILKYVSTKLRSKIL